MGAESNKKTFRQGVINKASTPVGPSYDKNLSSTATPPASHHAVADTGSTGHFVSVNAPYKNKRLAVTPQVVAMPDHTTIKSTHVVDLELPHLPLAACQGHVFPELGDTSLLSIGTLCDHGCIARFDKTTVEIELAGKVILTGSRSNRTNRLWHVELPATPQQHSAFATKPVNHVQTMADMVAFAHAALYSPVLSTLQKALKKNYVHIPGLTEQSLKRYPPESTATPKGHLDQQRQNLASTKASKSQPTERDRSDPTDVEELEDYYPEPTLDGQRTHVCFAAVMEHSGQVFTDQTGRFIVPSSGGNTQLLIVYDYDSNYIHAEPMKSKTAKEILQAYQRAHKKLVEAGLHPRLHRLDNEASAILKQFMHDEQEDYQLVPPGIHRRNAAERAIRTYKNHFIAGLCTTHPDFPLHLWDRLIEQATLTLNLLRGSRINPKLSAWAQVNGHFDFNRTPIAPPGTHVLVHEKPADRRTWAPHAVDAWYLGPAMESYRCYRTYVWATHAERITDTLTWKKTTVPIPTVDLATLVTAGIADIITALKQQPGLDGQTLLQFTDDQRTTLTEFAEILGITTPSTTTDATITAPPAAAPAATSEQPKKKVAFAPLPPSAKQPTATSAEKAPATGLRVQPSEVLDEEAPAAVLRVDPTESPAMEPALGEEGTGDESPLTYDGWIKVSRRRKRKSKSKTQEKKKSKATAPTRRTTRTRTPNPKYANLAADVDQAQQAKVPQAQPGIYIGSPADIATAVQQAFAATTEDGSIPFCGKAVNPDTGALDDYWNLCHSSDGGHWETSCCAEFGQLAQGYGKHAGTDTIFFIHRNQVPADREATYVQFVCDDRPQKEETRRVRICVGGDKIDYPGSTSTKTADLTTVKLLLNSVVSTPGAKFMGLDIKDFYLNNDLDRYEYIRIPIKLIPQAIIDQYALADKERDGYVYAEVRKGMYGLPQAGKVANDELVQHLAEFGYAPCKHTPGLFKHESRPILFSLVVDDFGVQYVA